MSKTFRDFTEGWIFCGYRILLYKYERAAVLATLPEELSLLRRIEERLKEEMAREKLIPPEEVILQINADGRYAGPLIGNRFQVMESFVPKGTYYIADHWRDDLLLRINGPAGDVRRFPSIADAEAFITNQFTPPETSDTLDHADRRGVVSGGAIAQESSMAARNARANAAAVKAAADADRKIGAKGPKATAKKAEADKQMAAVAKESKKNGSAKAPAQAAPPATAGRGVKDVSGRGDTIASMFRTLIAQGKLSKDQIHDKVEAHFGKKIPRNAFDHYSKDLERRRAAGQQI